MGSRDRGDLFPTLERVGWNSHTVHGCRHLGKINWVRSMYRWVDREDDLGADKVKGDWEGNAKPTLGRKMCLRRRPSFRGDEWK
jgi:hypothetical protein